MLPVTCSCQGTIASEDRLTETQPGTGRPATIYDVARAAGVSHQTVSRYLKGYEGIRPETKLKVTEALSELDYSPNLNARSLTTGRSHRIAALTHEISQVGPSKILEAANDAARDAGYVLDVITLDARDPANIQDSIDEMMQRDFAGVLALASTDEMARVFESTTFRVPTYVETDPDVLWPDARVHPIGFGSLLEHLAALGHRDLLHIAGSIGWIAARNRVREYEAAVDDLGLTSRGVVYGDWSSRSGYEVVMSLPEPLEVTAIVAANDQTALGAILALTDRGYRIPEDISVTGIDDIPEAAYLRPPLTTLRVDFGGQGRGAFNQLLARIEGAEPPALPVYPSELVVRRSTGIANR